MSKIIKFNSVVIDEENKFNVDIPVFDNINSEENNSEGSYEPEENGESADFWEVEEEASDAAEENPEDIIDNAHVRADEIINEAEAEAELIINEAKKNALAQYEKIKESAHKEGYDDGKYQAAVDNESLKREAEALLEEAKTEKEQMLKSAEPELIELAYNVICKVINDTKSINKDIVSCIIKKGLSQTKIMGDIFIHVSSEDFESVMNNKDDINASTEGNANVEIIKDSTMNSGDCLIETPFGNIDCGIDRQLKEVKNNLYYILENG